MGGGGAGKGSGVLGKVGGGGGVSGFFFFDKLTKNPNLKKGVFFLTKNLNQICKTKTGKKNWRRGDGGGWARVSECFYVFDKLTKNPNLTKKIWGWVGG